MRFPFQGTMAASLKHVEELVHYAWHPRRGRVHLAPAGLLPGGRAGRAVARSVAGRVVARPSCAKWPEGGQGRFKGVGVILGAAQSISKGAPRGPTMTRTRARRDRSRARSS